MTNPFNAAKTDWTRARVEAPDQFTIGQTQRLSARPAVYAPSTSTASTSAVTAPEYTGGATQTDSFTKWMEEHGYGPGTPGAAARDMAIAGTGMQPLTRTMVQTPSSQGIAPPVFQVTDKPQPVGTLVGYTAQQSDYLRSLNSADVLTQAAAAADPQAFMRSLAPSGYNPMYTYTNTNMGLFRTPGGYLGGKLNDGWAGALYGYTWGPVNSSGGQGWYPAASADLVKAPQ
jgi:hypothetical protein